jgi:hypothetical protein
MAVPDNFSRLGSVLAGRMSSAMLSTRHAISDDGEEVAVRMG